MLKMLKMWRKYKAITGLLIVTAIITNLAYVKIIEDPKVRAQSNNGNINIERINEIANERLGNSIVLYVGSPKVYVNNDEAQIDSSNPEVVPIVKKGRTLVPVRFVSESIGAKVDWDPILSGVTVTLGDKIIKMTLGSSVMYVNDEKIELEVKAEVENSRTLVPLRAIAEALGKKVFYNKGLIVIGEKNDVFNIDTEKAIIDGIISKINVLPSVGSYEKLKELLEQSQDNGLLNGRNKFFTQDNIRIETMKTMDESSVAASQKSINNSKSDDGYSATNVQVQGVDEADVVKTDGEYIYKVNKNKIAIARAYPAEEMKLVNTISFEDQEFYPQEIYIDNKYLIVIGNSHSFIPYVSDSAQAQTARRIVAPDVMPNRFQVVKAIVYDIADKSNVKNIREIEIEGNYISSRKIGSSVYMVTNKYLDHYYIMKNIEPEAGITPRYKDTAKEAEYISIPYPDIQYFPKFRESNYMIIAGFDVEKQTEKVNVSTYLGSGQNIYVSLENMYIAVNHYEALDNFAEKAKARIWPSPYYNELNTLVYKFSLNSGKTTYLAKGSVPGAILNQFSMDEYLGNFRIATTRNYGGRDNEASMDNNLYVLDDVMSIIGRLENIAPDEKIYSVRFMGEKAYMVTFKIVDPLFVIDLKDPRQPKILGALKIPGYSDYLHPYDENHIIGFGKDTIEIQHKDDKGKVIGSSAYDIGMKMAIFDVSDVNNPIEKYVERIGDRGTDSELLRNHKALLFSREKNLLAFPITVMKLKDGPAVKNNFPEYGQFEFQGSYVYNIDLQSGFKLKGKITHLIEDDYLKAGNYWGGSDKNVERAIYIGNVLYTLSGKMIQAHDINKLTHRKTIDIDVGK